MSKLREDSKAQRDDIVAWFRSMPGLIFSAVVLGGFAVWFVASFVIDLVQQVGG